MKEITSYKQVTMNPQNSYQKFIILWLQVIKIHPTPDETTVKLNILKCFLITLCAIINKAKSLQFTECGPNNLSGTKQANRIFINFLPFAADKRTLTAPRIC